MAKRTTKIVKTAERNIWTAKYEGLRIGVSLEEEVEWENLEERQTKFDAISKHLNNELVRTLNSACEELGLEEKRVFKSKDSEKDDVENDTSISDDDFDSIL